MEAAAKEKISNNMHPVWQLSPMAGNSWDDLFLALI
jgi:hypothetical protein